MEDLRCECVTCNAAGGQAGSRDRTLTGHCTTVKTTSAGSKQVRSVVEGTKWVGTNMSNAPSRVNRNSVLDVPTLQLSDQAVQLARELTKIPQVPITRDIGIGCLEIQNGELPSVFAQQLLN